MHIGATQYHQGRYSVAQLQRPCSGQAAGGSKTISTQNLRLEEGKAQSLDFNHRFNSTGFFSLESGTKRFNQRKPSK
jgi:hypothetical protein